MTLTPRTPITLVSMSQRTVLKLMTLPLEHLPWNPLGNSGLLVLASWIALEKAMAPYSSILACKIPWTEEPGRLQSMVSLRVRNDWATSLSCTGEGNGNPLQGSCLENPRDGGAWWAAIYGVAQSQTRLKRLRRHHHRRPRLCFLPSQPSVNRVTLLHPGEQTQIGFSSKRFDDASDRRIHISQHHKHQTSPFRLFKPVISWVSVKYCWMLS